MIYLPTVARDYLDVDADRQLVKDPFQDALQGLYGVQKLPVLEQVKKYLVFRESLLFMCLCRYYLSI
jgi:hypothetical protein